MDEILNLIESVSEGFLPTPVVFYYQHYPFASYKGNI